LKIAKPSNVKHSIIKHKDFNGESVNKHLWNSTSNELDGILRAAVAHFWFITIHPFDDGNGRIARAIGDMQLARADKTDLRFYSMSAQIERDREAYYDQLEHAQRGTLDITPWLTWFLGCLERSLLAAEASLADTLRLARFWRHARGFPLNARQTDMLKRIHAGFQGHLTSGKYAKLQKCSPDTALRDLQALVAHGLLRPSPDGGRSRHYLPDPDPEAPPDVPPAPEDSFGSRSPG
jgi:Fic family protein